MFPNINNFTSNDIYTASIGIIGLSILFILYKLTKKKIGTTDESIENWSKSNSIKLYKNLRIQGWSLELMIVLMGCYTALMTESEMVVTIFYLLIVSVSELCKLSVVEGLFRFPRPTLIFLALPALLISIAFTSESLLRVTADITSESNANISFFQDQIKSNLREKDDVANIIVNYESEKDRYRKSTSESHLLRINKEDIDKMEKEILLLRDLKERKIIGNNAQKKKSTQRSVDSLTKSLKSIESVISETKDSYQDSQESLRSSMLKEVDSAGWLESKNNLRDYYNDEKNQLQRIHLREIQTLRVEKDEIKLALIKANKEFNKLIPLSPETQKSVDAIDTKIEKINQKIENLKINDKSFIKKLSTKANQVSSNINIQKERILQINEDNTNLKEQINELKTKNLFYKIAGIFYNKQSSDLSEEELKKFLSWFIGISAIGMAILPVFLFAISVLIERSLKEEVNKKTLRGFFIKALVIFKESCLYISNITSSLVKITKEKRDISIEKSRKVKELKEKYQNNKLKYDLLRNASKQEEILKNQSEFELYMKGLFDKRLSDLDESVISRLEPILRKSMEDQIEKKEISSSVTKNYISKGFLSALLDEEDKK